MLSQDPAVDTVQRPTNNWWGTVGQSRETRKQDFSGSHTANPKTQQCLTLSSLCLWCGREGERELRGNEKTWKERKEMGWKNCRKSRWRSPTLVGSPCLGPSLWLPVEFTQLPDWVQGTGRARLWTLISLEGLRLAWKRGSSWLMDMLPEKPLFWDSESLQIPPIVSA